MPVSIDPQLIAALILGQGDRQRQLQDFPVLGDVWAEFAMRPNGLHDLLITPHRDYSAARVAGFIEDQTGDEPADGGDRMVSYLQGLVAARLDLEDLWWVVIPGTSWWHTLVGALEKEARERGDDFYQEIEKLIERQLKIERSAPAASVEAVPRAMRSDIESGIRVSNAVQQLVRLGLLIGVLRAAQADDGDGETIKTFDVLFERLHEDKIVALGRDAINKALARFSDFKGLEQIKERKGAHTRLIYLVSANRRAEFAVERSVPSIKADAARTLFSISCKDISWAILDSGIDETHPAFAREGQAGKTRVKATYDFGAIREILNKANVRNDASRARLAARLAASGAGKADDIDADLLELAKAMQEERPIDWSMVAPFIERKDPKPPEHPHGTHVAGILGGKVDEWCGVCPDINLYDFRVLGPDMEQSEFAVIAALQFIRYLNDRNNFSIIDGVNMSLSIPHNVRNYACGRTPVCLEAEALAANGVVIVAAAGNRGYQRYRLADDTSFDSYAASSITDPGNADGVITVGATHRYWPHTYGVSFFSSRGPTGDGRLKPDVLAPGERIESTVPGGGMDTMDGTSMAAPHVSGAAALLMARHRELKGRPARIKEILCDTATDLGRERSFQGHGMIDVLRAIQSF